MAAGNSPEGNAVHCLGLFVDINRLWNLILAGPDDIFSLCCYSRAIFAGKSNVMKDLGLFFVGYCDEMLEIDTWRLTSIRA